MPEPFHPIFGKDATPEERNTIDDVKNEFDALSYAPWTGWLVFSKKGLERFTKLPPALASGEYAIEVNVKAPREFFERPVPRAKIEVPSDVRLQPTLAVDWQGDPLAAAPPEQNVGGV